LIQLYSFKDDIVLDPFCGSGTTCLSASKTERHFIGYDINQKYVDMAENRVNSFAMQLSGSIASRHTCLDLSCQLFKCPGRPGIAQQGGEDISQGHTAPDPIQSEKEGKEQGQGDGKEDHLRQVEDKGFHAHAQTLEKTRNNNAHSEKGKPRLMIRSISLPMETMSLFFENTCDRGRRAVIKMIAKKVNSVMLNANERWMMVCRR